MIENASTSIKMTSSSGRTFWYLNLNETEIESNTNNNHEYKQNNNDSNDNNYVNNNVDSDLSKTLQNTNEQFVNSTLANTDDKCNLDNRKIASPNHDIMIYDLDENTNDNEKYEKYEKHEKQEKVDEEPKLMQKQQKQPHHLNRTYSNDNRNRTKKILYTYNDQHDEQQQPHICYQHTSQTLHLPQNRPGQEYKLHSRSGDFYALNNHGNRKHNNNDGANDDDNADNDDNDSLASIETLSDNISIWIDGEKHWISGVDVHTTCSDLICALLNYQNVQKKNQQQHQQQHQQQQQQQQQQNQYILKNATEDQMVLKNERNENVHRTSMERYCAREEKVSRQQEQTKSIITSISKKNVLSVDSKTVANKTVAMNNNSKSYSNNNNGNKHFAFKEAFNDTNQSVSINTKENFKAITSHCNAVGAGISIDSRMNNVTILPSGITAAQLTTEYVIVKQYRHCEEYLDGSTKVMDIVPHADKGINKKECELLLRRLAPPPSHIHIGSHNVTPPFSSLILTDKDSGMGSPVGSTRSAKFRRRKYKSSQWLAQANTLHPKLSHSSANERLMKIILAQDETIQKQLHLLREKEGQIAKIENDKHRKRERELGKNYLLETYLNGLEEAAYQPIETNQNNTFDKVFIGNKYVK